MPTSSLRWHRRSFTWRPAGEVIDPRHYGVDEVAENEARAFVIQHHYSGSYPAARVRVGLHQVGRGLVGVAVFSVPANEATLPAYIAGASNATAAELGRFVLLDEVPGNGESWFLARAWDLLRDRYPWCRWVLSFSDPLPRTRADGSLVTPGHVGTIYRAHNGRCVGRSTPRTLVLAPDGRALSPRALSKVRRRERGWKYAEEQLVDAGAPRRRPGESGDAYLARVLPAFRRVRHPGNLAYTWAIRDRRDLAACRPALPYPGRAELGVAA